MEALKSAFDEQMRETERLNKALAEKMEKINAMLTKFKSDLNIRIENTANELQRRTIEVKETGRLVEELRKFISLLT